MDDDAPPPGGAGASSSNFVSFRGKRGGLRDLLHFTGTNARGTNPHALPGAVHQRANRLQIDVPPALRHIVRVTDPAAELRPAATHFTNS